jgi:hypothetical protein
MSEFIDKLMVKYMTPANVKAVLMPAADPNGLLVQALLKSVYDTPYFAIREVDAIDILSQQFQVPIGDPIEVQGTFERVTPQAERIFASFTAPRLRPATWAGMELALNVTTKVEVTLGSLQTITSEDLSEVATLADFQAKFDFIDLADFMAKTRVATLQELKAEFPRLLKLQYAQPPAYNPADPQVVKAFRLPLCVLLADAIDLVTTLREVKSARLAAEASRPHLDRSNGNDILMGSAWMVVFPSAAIGATTPSAAAIASLFAAEGFVAAFDTV